MIFENIPQKLIHRIRPPGLSNSFWKIPFWKKRRILIDQSKHSVFKPKSQIPKETKRVLSKDGTLFLPVTDLPKEISCFQPVLALNFHSPKRSVRSKERFRIPK
ncbi:hypothetical protein CH370_00735 [Leptospira kmetyi]|nr:hypothetical protein CH370_00735 [Leptospira kmetyi]